MDLAIAFAHPDDETVFLGGTLAMLAAAGHTIHYLCATRGEGGEVGEPPVCVPEALGAVRSAELECAVQALGGRSLAFLGYRDPAVDDQGNGRAFAADPADLGRRLSEEIRRLRAMALICHGSNGEYGHPAHRLMNTAARAAIPLLPPPGVPVYFFSADFDDHPRRQRSANLDDPAHFVIDVRSVLERKLKAARCHRTQAALFVRRASREAGRTAPLEEVLLRLESLHRCWPDRPGPPDDPLADALRTACAGALRELAGV